MNPNGDPAVVWRDSRKGSLDKPYPGAIDAETSSA
jgi:hypothetical protein